MPDPHYELPKLAALRSIKAVLKPGGIFAFESRNPAIDWPTLWHRDFTVDAPGQPVDVSLRVTSWDGRMIRFVHEYQFPEGNIPSPSTLLFLTAEQITSLLEEAGFRIAAFFGDWAGGPFDPETSHEIVFQAISD